MPQFRTPELASRAEALARQLHATQTDKLGRPYVEHLEAVVGILLRRWPDAPEEVVAAAWLQGSMCDVGESRVSLYAAGIPLPPILIVEDLSRPMGSIPTFRGWTLKALAAYGAPWAIRIKIAALEHNSNLARAIQGNDPVERRYAPARAVLERALAEREAVG